MASRETRDRIVSGMAGPRARDVLPLLSPVLVETPSTAAPRIAPAGDHAGRADHAILVLRFGLLPAPCLALVSDDAQRFIPPREGLSLLSAEELLSASEVPAG